MSEKVRVRFAPSPTGPLHVGGVRTALYNYCFAKKNGGTFILRIEDTDQQRFVPGAEEYIIEALKWCGIAPDEGQGFGNGEHSPYRQSERKHLYKQYADALINSGHAYYAFDTTEELESMRKESEAKKSSFAYGINTRMSLKNSLTLQQQEVNERLQSGEPYVVRIKTPENEIIRVNDLIRGEVEMHTSQMDDKVLFKSDGMPTYHLANVVDDYLMKITHVIRGEEWLPSAPLHVLLYRSFGWELNMPQFAHLPLLLKPDGHGKLSKRDGDRLGFPVFPLEWKDPSSGEISSGYREQGYYPEAVINILALLGWHTHGDQEIFSLNELVQEFSLDRVTKAGAKFDPEKAKWFNQHYLRQRNGEETAQDFLKYFSSEKNRKTNAMSDDQYEKILQSSKEIDHFIALIELTKEKIHFISEAWPLIECMFTPPVVIDKSLIAKKWNDNAKKYFEALIPALNSLNNFSAESVEQCFKETAATLQIKPGDVMQLFRILLSGKPSGIDLMKMAMLLGKKETTERLERSLQNVLS